MRGDGITGLSLAAHHTHGHAGGKAQGDGDNGVFRYERLLILRFKL